MKYDEKAAAPCDRCADAATKEQGLTWTGPLSNFLEGLSVLPRTRDQLFTFGSMGRVDETAAATHGFGILAAWLDEGTMESTAEDGLWGSRATTGAEVDTVDSAGLCELPSTGLVRGRRAPAP